MSGEALHHAIVTPASKSNFVSINQKEAADKIVYAKQFYGTIPEESGLRVPIYSAAEYEYALHEQPFTSVIQSQPASSAIRGGEKDVYFDEAAFVRDFQKLYDAAMPATTRGKTRMTVNSTPYGKGGLFSELATNREKYPEWSVHIVPWWECSIMSVNVSDSTALAPAMDTQERVREYGTENIKTIYRNMGLEAFQQEYECNFTDESASYYPWDLVIANINDDLNDQRYHPETSYNIGIDIAKSVDKTVVTVSTLNEDTDTLEIQKLFETQDDYEDQYKFFCQLIDDIKPSRVTVDATGVGAVIAGRLKGHYGGIIEEVIFTRQNKEVWATKFKGDLQMGRIRYPRKRELLQEIHAIERLKSEAGNYIFHAKQGEHDDYFWSAVLSCYGEGRSAPNISFAW